MPPKTTKTKNEVTEEVTEVKQEAVDNTVQLTRDELNELRALKEEMISMRKQQSPIRTLDDVEKFHTAHLGFYKHVKNIKKKDPDGVEYLHEVVEEMPIIRYQNARERVLENGKERLYIQIVALDESENEREFDVDYMKFFNGEMIKYRCTLLNKYIKEARLKQGTPSHGIKYNPVKKKGGFFRPGRNDESGALEEIRVEHEYELEIIEGPWQGKKLTVTDRAVNP